MTELNTVKDLRQQDGLIGVYRKDGSIVEVDDLKQEAIKWIKFLENNRPWEDESLEQAGIQTIDTDGCIGAIQVLTKFFNITDEDLK